LAFDFVANPKPNTNQKKVNTRIKEDAKSGKYNAEVLFWSCLFTPYLLSETTSRQIQPRPQKVVEDTDAQMQTAKANEQKSAVKSHTIAIKFVAECIKKWDKDDKPASRSDVNQAWLDYCKSQYVSPIPTAQDALVSGGFLMGMDGQTRFATRFGGKSYSVYKAKKSLVVSGCSDDELVMITLITMPDAPDHSAQPSENDNEGDE
jgi:hypothetical protein